MSERYLKYFDEIGSNLSELKYSSSPYLETILLLMQNSGRNHLGPACENGSNLG